MSTNEEKLDISKYPSVAERYFTPKYYKNKKVAGEDVCILCHSNKICVITLAERHPILRDRKKIKSVDYQFDSVNRLCNMVVGKGKRGAQTLSADSPLCRVVCEDDSKYYIPCGLKCQLLETNDTLKNKPSVLLDKPLSDGYIAIVLAKLKEYKAEMAKLQCKEDYVRDGEQSTDKSVTEDCNAGDGEQSTDKSVTEDCKAEATKLECKDDFTKESEQSTNVSTMEANPDDVT